MPISTLDPAALAGLSAGQLADMALERDQAARRMRKANDPAWREADAESERLAILARNR